MCGGACGCQCLRRNIIVALVVQDRIGHTEKVTNVQMFQLLLQVVVVVVFVGFMSVARVGPMPLLEIGVDVGIKVLRTYKDVLVSGTKSTTKSKVTGLLKPRITESSRKSKIPLKKIRRKKSNKDCS